MFPRSAPHHSGLLDLDGQQVYWEESGDPAGIPALYLHGGPGSGLRDGGYRTKLDPERFRIVALDQRGCGRSTPLANDPRHDLDGNTTQRLIADLEALRVHLGVEAWAVNGARVAVAAPWVVLLLMSTQSDVIQRYRSTTGTLILAFGAVTCVVAYRVMMRIGRLPTERRILS